MKKNNDPIETLKTTFLDFEGLITTVRLVESTMRLLSEQLANEEIGDSLYLLANVLGDAHEKYNTIFEDTMQMIRKADGVKDPEQTFVEMKMAQTTSN